MKSHRLATLAVIAALAQQAWADNAGRCHFHGSKPVAEATLLGCATQRMQALVSAGKLDRSWATLPHEKLEVVDGKKGREWKLSFHNPAVTDPAKARLYMFFTLPGNFIAANHSGD